MKILLLEDDTVLASILEDYLLEEAYAVVQTYSMKKALTLAEEDKFEIGRAHV